MMNAALKGFLLAFLPLVLSAQPEFDFNRYFSRNTMRIDYYHTGNSTDEFISLHQVYEQGPWAGPEKKLLDIFNRGRYTARIYDVRSGALLVSKGFDSYFGEYKTTDQALSGVFKTYEETLLLPFPKDSIRFEVLVRDRQNNLKPLFSQTIDPNAVSVIREDRSAGTDVIRALYNRSPGQHVDIAIIGDGYRSDEKEKFSGDLKKFTNIFLNKEPFKSYKHRFNIYGIFTPSRESGCDEPTKRIYRNTAVNTTFNSLLSPRYLLTEDLHKVHDLASAAPSDFIIILVNHERYGGGGIYNSFATCTSDDKWSHFVFIHEFGHLFAGLADEYYSSSTAYNEFYPSGVEPLEPNITALLSPGKVKWSALVSEDTPIPTPWDKAPYDTINVRFSRSYDSIMSEINESTSRNAPEAVLDSLRRIIGKRTNERNKRLSEITRQSPYAGKVGAFEGAGYSSTGLYRPMLDCVMFQVGNYEFCKVCSKAIIEIIEYYSEP